MEATDGSDVAGQNEEARGGDGGGETAHEGSDFRSSADANPVPASTANLGVEQIDDRSEPVSASASAALIETTKGFAGGGRRPAGLEQFEEDELSRLHGTQAGRVGKAIDAGPRAPPNEVEGPAERDSDLQIATVSNPFLAAMWSRPIEREGEASSVDTIDFDPSGDVQEQASAAVRNIHASAESGISLHGIAETYAVDDDVIIAEPQLPLWKQTKVRMMLAIFFVALAVVAVALGVTLSRDDAQPPVVTQFLDSTSTHAPSISTSPTLSAVPSSAPTECSRTIDSNKQEIDLLNPDADLVKTAMDGPNLIVAYIVASRYTNFGRIDEGSFYVEFFKLQGGGDWQRVHYYTEPNTKWALGFDHYNYYDIALSGRTVVIGLPSQEDQAGAVHVFRESNIETWERVVSPEPSFRKSCRFGEFVDIDGDFLVAADNYLCIWGAASSANPNAAYLFKQTGDELKEFAVLTGPEDGIGAEWLGYGEVVVEGNTVAYVCWDEFAWEHHVEVYTYDPQNKSASKIQTFDLRHVNIKSLALSGNFLVSLVGPDGYWVDWEVLYEPVESVIIYRREDEGQPFTLVQYLNSSDYDDEFGQAFALDADQLVVGGTNQTHIFSLQPDGTWDETLTLGESYEHYQLSGRRLIATNQNQVYSMDIADCTQPMPTRQPTVSIAPTTCHWVNVQIMTVSGLDSEDRWDAAIQKRDILESDSTDVMIHNHPPREPWWDTYEPHPSGENGTNWFENATCLRSGEYQFVFRGERSQGPISDVYYTVESDGLQIAREKVSLRGSYVEVENVHPFSIPFVSKMDNSPTGPPLPPRPTPTTRPPTASPRPTKPPIQATPWPTWSPVSTRTPRPVKTVSPLWKPTTAPSPTKAATSPTSVPSMTTSMQSPAETVCLTESECEAQMRSNKFVAFYTGSYADYGCFSKGSNLFWGIGGTEEQMATSPLSGVKERVWCSRE